MSLKKKLKDIRKCLMTGKGEFFLSIPASKQMKQLGYVKGDVVSAVLKGSITEIQYSTNLKFVIEGIDLSHNPIVVILSEKSVNCFEVVTVMPPIDRRRFKNCVS